jgi:tripartite-type tricarboxylate transporter receptor subunit TctC
MRGGKTSPRYKGISALVASVALVSPAFAADSFYAGKTITVIIGSGPGGGYDFYGRLVARYLGHYVPGEPTVVAQNMPGAGSLNAANYLFSVARKDGTMVGLVSPSIPLEHTLGNPGIRFEPLRYTWIGRLAASIQTTFTWQTSKVKSIEDARRTEAVIGGIEPTSPPSFLPHVLNQVIGTKFKIITGYADSNATLLALERGEIEGASASWNTMKVSRQDWLKNKKINLLVQYANERIASLPDVPAAGELGRTAEETQLLRLFMNQADIGYAILGPPEIPADRVKILRDAFAEMLKDKGLLDEVKKNNLDFLPARGEQLQTMIADAVNVSPEVRDRARQVMHAD